MRRMQAPQRQRGIVLLAAMFLVVIATTMVSNLMWTSHVEVRRTRSILALEQGAQYALAGEAWAAEILNQDRQESEIDSLEELWAATPPAFPIDGGQILGQIEDLQGRLNLNNLISATGEKDEAWYLVLQRLLESLNIEARVADQIVDWLDPDQEVAFPNGAEDDVYTGTTPAYRTPNTFITHISELLAIEDAQNALAIEEKFTYLLGPIKIALRPRIITAQQLADLEIYGRAIWDDSIKLEQMWHAGELDAYIDIEEELEIARLQPWRGGPGIFAADGLFGFGAHLEAP